jgi:hypothetical protein
MVWLQEWCTADRGGGAGFGLFITADQEISHQQNLTGRKIAVLVLSTNNNRSVIKEQVAEISVAIDAATPGSFVFLNIGHGRK